MKYRRRRVTTSIRCQRGISEAVAPMKLGDCANLKPASSPSIARVAATAVSSETTVPISSISAKPFTSAVATANRISAVIAVTTFASTIVLNALLRSPRRWTRARFAQLAPPP